MTRTALSVYSDLLLTIYRQAQELPVHEFQDAILAALKPALPFDSSMWGTATMTPGGIDIHAIHLHNTSPDMLRAYERVKHQDTAAARVASTPRGTIGFDAEAEFARHDQGEIRTFLQNFGHRHCFITSDANPVTHFVQWVSLFRADPAMHCTESETELLAMLAPHLMQALAINRRVHLDRLTGDVARESWSVAIADPRGVLYHVDQGFRRMVRSEWPQHTDDAQLPPPLLDSLMAGDGQVTGRQAVFRRTLEQGLLFLRARPRAPVDALSAREFAVAQLLAAGLSQKEAAARVARSPETIRSQTKAIFEKLQINSVTMLAPHVALRG